MMDGEVRRRLPPLRNARRQKRIASDWYTLAGGQAWASSFLHELPLRNVWCWRDNWKPGDGGQLSLRNVHVWQDRFYPLFRELLCCSSLSRIYHKIEAISG